MSERAATSPAPRVVAASEAALLTIARALVGAVDVDSAWAALIDERAMPATIGPDAAALLAETLARGAVRVLARAGARPAATLVGGRARRGRLWQRHPPPTLRFSAASLALVRWLTAVPLAAPPSVLPPLPAPAEPLALGDQLLVWLALERLEPPMRAALRGQPLVRAAALAWLGHAHDLGGLGPPAPAVLDALAGFADGAGAVVLEALTPALAARWCAAEAAKARTVDPAALIAAGDAEDAVLARWFAVCDRAGRRELTGFVLDATLPLAADGAWRPPGLLDPRTPLAQRGRARLAAGALWRAIAAWRRWDDEHRATRYIDDGYAVAQHLLARFEAVGAVGVERAAARLQALAALPTATPPPSGTMAPGAPR